MNNLTEYVEQYGQEKLNLIKNNICKGANNDEFALFLSVCNRLGLDPFCGQINCIKRGGVYRTEVAIGGLRLPAHRDPLYAGQSEPEFIFDEKNKLFCAKVRIYKFSPTGERYEAAVGVAYWDEYAVYHYGKLADMWEKMPKHMLGKCAEADGLRKTYSILSGIYISEEMMGVKDQSQQREKTSPLIQRLDSQVEKEKSIEQSLPVESVVETHKVPSPKMTLQNELENGYYAEEEEGEIVTFGKHKGKKLSEVPTDYLCWMREQEKCAQKLDAIRELQRRGI